MAEKPTFSKDQTFKASDASKNFGELSKKAQTEPLIIQKRGSYNSVLLGYDLYERMYMALQNLQDQIIAERIERLDQDPSSAVPWRHVRRTKPE